MIKTQTTLIATAIFLTAFILYALKTSNPKHAVSAVVVKECGLVGFGLITYSDGTTKHVLPPDDVSAFDSPESLVNEAMKAPKENQFAITVHSSCENQDESKRETAYM